MLIILDTNFLIYCTKHKLDYVENINNLINDDFELVVPKQVIEELNIVSNKQKQKIPLHKRKPRYRRTTGKDKVAATLALKILSHNKIKTVVPIGDTVDNAIVNLSKTDNKNIVCTLDKEMRNKLKRVILISKGNKLILSK